MKNRAYYTLDKHNRLLAIAGAPISYLKQSYQLNLFHFLQVSFQENNRIIFIEPHEQIDFIKQFVKRLDCVGESALYGIGSTPTNQASYELAVLLSRTYIQYALQNATMPKIKWVDIGNHANFQYLTSQEYFSFIVIHGLSEGNDLKKLDLAKDYIRRSSHATTLVLATTPNILTYSMHRLETNLDGALQLGNRCNRVVV